MKDTHADWTPSRWAAVVGGAVVFHVAASWIFARPGFVPALFPSPATPRSGWVDGRPDPLSGQLVSPTRFALPAGSAFSADAARGLPRVDYEVSAPHGGPTFLGAGADGSRLGSVPRGPEPRSARPLPLPPPEGAPPAARLAATRGSIELHAPSVLGNPVRAAEVPPWNGPEAPQATRVEFAVNPDGAVVAARTTLSSGSREADSAALEAVRRLRFEARVRRTGLASLDPEPLVWAVATLHPVAAAVGTNPPPPVPAPPPAAR